ncbi:MAG TPA: hypothetical protein VM597_36715 [Gemmataceae bacterium]|jgi:hypothetical protein|nr:hypothetical protein [Gemmataceae bacterium]
MPDPPDYRHVEPDLVIRNQRPVPLAGCLFHAIVFAFMAFPLLCIVKVWLGVAYVIAMIVFMGVVTPGLVSRVRLRDRLTVQPGDRTWRVTQLASLVVRPDPREDYADSDRLYELTFRVQSGERFRLMATADDARRALEWGRTRDVVVENLCDRGP